MNQEGCGGEVLRINWQELKDFKALPGSACIGSYHPATNSLKTIIPIRVWSAALTASFPSVFRDPAISTLPGVIFSSPNQIPCDLMEETSNSSSFENSCKFASKFIQ